MEEKNKDVSQNNQSQTINIVGFVLSFFIPLAGLIVSIIGLSKSKKTGVGKGLSIAGIIISSVLMLLGILIIILATFFIFRVVNDNDFDNTLDNLTTSAKCVMSYDCELNTDNTYSCKYKIDDTEEDITCDKEYINEFNMKESYSNDNESLVSCDNYDRNGRCIYYKEGNIEIIQEVIKDLGYYNYYINNKLVANYIEEDSVKLIENNYVLIDIDPNIPNLKLYDKDGNQPIDFSKVNSFGFVDEVQYDNNILTIHSSEILDNIDENEICKYKSLDTIVEIVQEIKYENGEFSKPTTIRAKTLKEAVKEYYNIAC